MSDQTKPETPNPRFPGPVEPGPEPLSGIPKPRRKGKGMVLFLAALLLGGSGLFWLEHRRSAQSAAVAGRASRMADAPVPVVAGTVERRDVPIYLEGLGTAQAFNTVMVRSRVDGQIQRIAFTEGQDVHPGDLLAQIDPSSFQAQLDQNVAKKAQDAAQLQVARLTLKGDAELLAGKILAQQDFDTQQALVEQLQASVQADQAAIEDARVQLGYTRITSPIAGRTGIRLVDEGNIVHASDSNGLVVLTQLRPISVVFTLPEQDLPQIQPRLAQGGELVTYAMGRDDHTLLGQGKLAVIDNQIDTTTGTIRLKATFPNQDLRLWPGQFVNVRLLLETRRGGTVVPGSVVQRGPQGDFAFVLSNNVALVRPIKVGQIEQGEALIDSGLHPGEQVVVDGQYKLQSGSKVTVTAPGPAAALQPASTNNGEKGAS
jgi:membrane fusion protein, multidrug efflux system